jgi:two-component system sensor histidine kinase YesM
MNNLIQKANRIPLRHKLFLSYAILAAIPFVIFFAINKSINQRELERRSIYSAIQTMRQTQAYLESKVAQVANVLTVASLNSAVQDIFKAPPTTITSWLGEAMTLSSQFAISSQNTDIANMTVYMEGLTSRGFEVRPFADLARVEEEDWYREAMAETSSPVWLPAEIDNKVYTVSAVRAVVVVKDLANYGHQLGLLAADIPYTVFERVTSSAKITESTTVFILNRKGELVTNPEKADFTAGILDEILQMSQVQSKGDDYSDIDIGGGKAMLFTQPIDKTDWVLAMVVPYSEVLAQAYRSQLQIQLILGATILLMLPFSFALAKFITDPFKRLTSRMKAAEAGDFAIVPEARARDEIGRLMDSFNHMMGRIEQLMDEKFRMGQKLKNTELRVLQAQINPHFLYNILDIINWSALKMDTEKIPVIIENLSKYYKLCLSNGEDIIALEDELEQIRTYMKIQNIRFGDVFGLGIDVPEAMYPLRIPKLTLQPIVENAILHGILESPAGRGTITITGRIADGRMTLAVADDGAGMATEILEELKRPAGGGQEEHYGIKSIAERFSILYGDKFALDFKSATGQGTEVTLSFPAGTFSQIILC